MSSDKSVLLKRKKTEERILPYALSGLIVAAVMFAVYAVNSIFPFGSGTVAADDMVQQTIPAFTHFSDSVFGRNGASLLWDWNTGGGIGTITLGYYMLQPLKIIFTLPCTLD